MPLLIRSTTHRYYIMGIFMYIGTPGTNLGTNVFDPSLLRIVDSGPAYSLWTPARRILSVEMWLNLW